MRSNLIRKTDRYRGEVDQVMSRIREEAKNAIAAADVAPRRLLSKQNGADAAGGQQSVLYSDELNYLNANWHNWNPATEITSHRPIVGRLIVKIKRFFIDLVWNYLLKGYFERERQFQMNLVKYLNANARYIDSRNADLFWQLIEKVDNDVSGLNERIDQLFDHAEMRLQDLERGTADRIAELERARDMLAEIAAKTDQDLAGLDEYSHELESKIAQLRIGQKHSSTGASAQIVRSVSTAAEQIPGEFFSIGARAEGTEAELKEQLRELAEHFTDAHGLVVDFGCERGEFLELLVEKKIPAVGLSLSSDLAEHCQAKGLPVEHAEGVRWLNDIDDGSLGGIFAGRAANIISAGELGLFLELAGRKVRPGGRIVLELANPQSLVAMAKSLSSVPRQSASYQPDVMRMLIEAYGMRVLQSNLRRPFDSEGLLQPVELDDQLPGRWHQALRPLNDNLKRLNDLLFGFRSYVIVAEVQE